MILASGDIVHNWGALRPGAPTPDHDLPLLYALGATRDDEKPSFPVEGFDLGAISIRSVQWDFKRSSG